VPEGDFSLLTQLPALYLHCKETEDSDMEFIDFIKDHLINIDALFDNHPAGDDQKPRQTFQFHNLQHTIAYIKTSLLVNVTKPMFLINKMTLLMTEGFHSDYTFCIFHPPDTHLKFKVAIMF
jgi:hypothetical protein